jgi:hypothetical protein
MNVHPKAQELLDEFGYRWDPYHYGFRRIRRRGEDLQQYRIAPPTVLPRESVDDLGLGESSTLDGTQLDAALSALRRQLVWLESQKRF